MEKLTSEALPTLSQMTFEDSSNVIGLQGFSAGHSPLNSQAGQKTNPSGQEVVRAPHSVQPGKRKTAQSVETNLSRIRSRLERLLALSADTNGLPTQDTSGPSLDALSKEQDPQSLLGSKLRARMALYGSLEYELRWKHWDTALGLPICALRASARRTSDSGCTGWPTPDTNQQGGAQDPEKRKAGGHSVTLQDAATLAGWPTCSSRDWKDSPGMATTGVNPDGSTRTRLDQLPRVAALAGWPTPMAGTPAKGQNNEAGNTDSSRKTVEMIPLRGWATPRAEDAESSGMRHNRAVADTLSAQAGQDLNSSIVETEKRGVLNPGLGRWLQGYPVEWCQAAIRALRMLKQQPKRVRRGSGATETA
jgi:hypothetical protein